MEQPLQPDLVKSATDDDDNSSASGKGHDKALEYLLRYETMVRQQEAEDMATLAHIRPILKRVEKLSGEESTPADDIMAREFTFVQLQKALEAIQSDSSEVMTTDRQLMLVLRTLTKKSPETEEECISWAEFYQCYKTVVAGMQTLQYVPTSSLVRSRTKDRTLSILSLFEPPSTKLFNEDVPHTIHTSDEEALVGDRRYVPEELRRKRKRTGVLLVFGILLAVCALFFSGIVTDPASGNHLLEFDDVKSRVTNSLKAAKKATASWLHEPMDAEAAAASSPSAKLEATPRDLFSELIGVEHSYKSMSDDVNPAIVQQDSSKALAVLAGATGVAIAPAVFRAAAFLQVATGLGGVGVLSVFTVALAPVMNGIDIMLGKLLRALRIRKH